MAEAPPQFSRAAESLIADLRGIPDHTPARMRRRATRDMPALVEELLVKHRIGRPSPEQAVRDRWPELVGAANASYSHPALIDSRGRLTVMVSHAVVRSELLAARELILTRIRALPGCAGIRDLVLRAS